MTPPPVPGPVTVVVAAVAAAVVVKAAGSVAVEGVHSGIRKIYDLIQEFCNV